MSTQTTSEHKEIFTGKIIMTPADNWLSFVNISQVGKLPREIVLNP